MELPPHFYLGHTHETLIMAQIVEERLWYNMAKHEPTRPLDQPGMDKRLANVKSIIGLLTGSRIYVGINRRSLQRIWDIIRMDESLTDAVVELTIEFQRRWLVTHRDMSLLIDNLSKAYSICSSFITAEERNDYCVIDNEITKAASDFNDVEALLLHNTWFVMLLALEPLAARL